MTTTVNPTATTAVLLSSTLQPDIIGQVFVPMQDYLTSLGFGFTTATAIAIAIAIAAAGAVPEPESWALMIGGFMLAGGAMRDRRRALRLGYR